jgi:hypothetical protein
MPLLDPYWTPCEGKVCAMGEQLVAGLSRSVRAANMNTL